MLSSGTLFIALIFTFVIWYIRFRIRRRRLYKLAAQYDGPCPLPIIGNVLTGVRPLTDITDRILEGCLYYKSPIRLWFGSHLTVHIWDPDNVKIILNSPHVLEKEPHLYKMAEASSGHGLITSPVDEWRRHRKLIAPVFNQQFLERFYDIFSNHSNKLVQNVCSKVDKGIFDVHEYLGPYAMDTIMDTILDFTEAGIPLSNTHDFFRRYESVLLGSAARMTNILYLSDFIFNRSSVGRKFNEDKLIFDRYISTLIKKWEENSINRRACSTKPNNQTESYKPMKLMDHLASASDGSGKFTTEELHGEINTLIAAATDTTPSTIGYALVLLGMHPEIQEKVRQEVLHVIGNKRQLEYTDLRNLEYLERIIKETLRLYPPLAALGRYTEQEIQLTNHVIPANTSILIVQLGLHRDPNIWPNPTKFDPDRFLSEEEIKRHPFSWIPFSAGPRDCIARRFAYIAMKSTLSTFLLNYKLATDYTSVEDIKLTMMGVLKPTNGYKISITRR